MTSRSSALVVAALFAFTLACGSSSNPGGNLGPDGGVPDSGVPHHPDGGGSQPDGGGLPDGGGVPDGGSTDGGSQIVVNPIDPNNANIDSDCDGLSDYEEFSTVY